MIWHACSHTHIHVCAYIHTPHCLRASLHQFHQSPTAQGCLQTWKNVSHQLPGILFANWQQNLAAESVPGIYLQAAPTHLMPFRNSRLNPYTQMVPECICFVQCRISCLHTGRSDRSDSLSKPAFEKQPRQFQVCSDANQACFSWKGKERTAKGLAESAVARAIKSCMVLSFFRDCRHHFQQGKAGRWLQDLMW